MIVRDIRATDRAAWEPLWRGYLEFYKSAFDPAQADVTFARLLDPNEPMFALVAEEENALIGVVQCVLHRSTWFEREICYLQDLFTLPEARGRGVGRALIEAVYMRAEEEAWPRVYWQTHESNGTARLLYDRVAKNSGFIVYRRDWA
ncbi:MAG: N-acetyltransferase family protein [Hyphomonadaceae bacterium]